MYCLGFGRKKSGVEGIEEGCERRTVERAEEEEEERETGDAIFERHHIVEDPKRPNHL